MTRCAYVKGKFKERCPGEAVEGTDRCEMHTPQPKKPEPGEVPIVTYEVTLKFKIHDTEPNCKEQMQRFRETFAWRDGFRLEVL